MEVRLREGLTGDFFERIQNKDVFEAELYVDFFDRANEMGVLVSWNKRNALDAFFEWTQDLKRLDYIEKKLDRPDHLKCAAYLIYWLCRSSPVSNFVFEDDINEEKEFMLKYGREYLAFDLGYRAAQLYERKVNNRDLKEDAFPLHSSMNDVCRTDFIETACHVLKLKFVTPDAILLVLKAVFLRP
ncbi:hypothetical protein [Methylobacterium radiodurans]|uniref:hypothetical protein n=1 Tax=Methylobacterium radiodurans TaxID=2202828 RepID=UPI0013A5699E|nr:hypothetical protein [Methylobacterium radiodurans]